MAAIDYDNETQGWKLTEEGKAWVATHQDAYEKAYEGARTLDGEEFIPEVFVRLLNRAMDEAKMKEKELNSRLGTWTFVPDVKQGPGVNTFAYKQKWLVSELYLDTDHEVAELRVEIRRNHETGEPEVGWITERVKGGRKWKTACLYGRKDLYEFVPKTLLHPARLRIKGLHVLDRPDDGGRRKFVPAEFLVGDKV